MANRQPRKSAATGGGRYKVALSYQEERSAE